MNSSTLKHLLLAVLLVVLTVVTGPLVPKAQQVNSLAIGEELGVLPMDPELRVILPEKRGSIQMSSQSEVLFFDLDSEGPYTLRYLTIFVESEGLVLPNKWGDWKLYTVADGRVNYGEQVGYAEVFKDGFLRLRVHSTPAAGYWGEGEAQFALVAPIYKIAGAEKTSLGLSFPTLLPEGLDWEFVAGHETGPWMDVEAGRILGVELVRDLGYNEEI
ncbi:hypothetical protein IPG41_04865 [Candidatus Peregrinibacteria bacterium]|nr:MAG: hypothetical protein IPG41_04865 [Candidatus Peregrinibacteria bacterium]